MDLKTEIREYFYKIHGSHIETDIANIIAIAEKHIALQLQQTGVNKSVLLKESDLVDLGFEIVRWKEPSQNVGMDRFWGFDYAIMRINQKTGRGDDLIIRFRENKFILDDFYGVRFFTVVDIEDLISSLTRAS